MRYLLLLLLCLPVNAFANSFTGTLFAQSRMFYEPISVDGQLVERPVPLEFQFTLTGTVTLEKKTGPVWVPRFSTFQTFEHYEITSLQGTWNGEPVQLAPPFFLQAPPGFPSGLVFSYGTFNAFFNDLAIGYLGIVGKFPIVSEGGPTYMFLPGQPRLPVPASITGLQEVTSVPVPEPPAVWTVLTAGFAYCALSGFHRLRRRSSSTLR